MTQTGKKDLSRILTLTGIGIMTVLVLTGFTPASRLKSCSLLAGIVFFFIAEAVSKTPAAESGLRFSSFFTDLRKCSPLLWLVLPAVSSAGSVLLGKILFDNLYASHVLGRTGTILNYGNALILIGELMISALGEEIAFRGFFTGKGMKLFGFWPSALLSSAVFAFAHLAEGNPAVVAFDLLGIFIDAVIYSAVYRKTENCLISTVSHFTVNIIGIIIVFAFFR